MADVPLMNNPMTTAGDVVYGGASGAPTRLAVGTAGQVLKVNAGATAPEWGAASGSGVGNLWAMRLGASQTLGTGLTQIAWDTSHIDGGGSVIDLANDRFVAPATGLYMAFATWLWEGTAPAISCAMSVKVGTTEQAAIVRAPNTPGANGGYSGSWPLSLTSGDFVTLFINPNGTASVTARGNASAHLSTVFTLVRIT